FTYSFFVSLFFALEDASIDNEPAAIWAINSTLLREKYLQDTIKKIRERIENEDDTIKQDETIELILSTKIDKLLALTPFNLNQRLVLQQGVFLIPLSFDSTFMNLLENTSSDKNETTKKIIKIKLICKDHFLKKALYELNRMNVNRATLFPGIDGFSKYLKMIMPFRDLLAIDKT
ncbi:unnamed protein product, partial [marine sediment metagenome]